MDDIIKPLNIVRLRKRSVFFTILLIMTFAGSGIGFILSILMFFQAQLSDFLNTLPILDAIIQEDMFGNILYIILKALAFAGSFIGAILMWKLKKKGFFFYLIFQILLLVLPFVFLIELGWAYLFVRMLINLIFTLLFIMLYSFQLKNLE